MAVKGIGLDDYVFFSAEDEDPKTELVMKPLKRFDFIRLSNIFFNINADSVDEVNANVFARLTGKEGKETEKEAYDFLIEHCTEIRNIEIDGELKSGKIEDYIDFLPPMFVFACITDAIGRVMVDEEEEKN